MSSILWDFFLVIGLILVYGVLSAAKISVLVAARGRLKDEQEKNWPTQLVLALGQDFASLNLVARLAMTLVGTLAGVIAGSHLLSDLIPRFETSSVDWVAQHAIPLATATVVLGTGCVWQVLGLLLPQRLALTWPDRTAQILVYPLHWSMLICQPIAWLLSKLADGIATLWGMPVSALSIVGLEQFLTLEKSPQTPATAEALVTVKAQRLAERTVREIMRPRIEIDALDVDTPSQEVIGAAAMAGFSRLPVHEGDLDHIIGFIYMKDLLRQQFMGWPIEVRKLIRPALLVPATIRLDKLLELFRVKRTQMAIVLDQFGGTEGMVTMKDVLEEIVGEIHDEWRQEPSHDIVRRSDSTWMVSGVTNLDDLLDQIGLSQLRSTSPREYTTVGGLIMSLLDRIPQNADVVEWHGLRLEVVRMDGPRIDRILVSRTDCQ